MDTPMQAAESVGHKVQQFFSGLGALLNHATLQRAAAAAAKAAPAIEAVANAVEPGAGVVVEVANEMLQAAVHAPADPHLYTKPVYVSPDAAAETVDQVEPEADAVGEPMEPEPETVAAVGEPVAPEPEDEVAEIFAAIARNLAELAPHVGALVENLNKLV